jgi:hypothetical protein
MNPAANFRDVDVLTNRNSLRHLLGFAQGRVEKSFRIDLYIIQNTLILSRHEKQTRQRITPSQYVGFGHNFESAFTKPEPGLNSSGHHRVIRYKLGALECAVRFEVDAFVDEDESLSSKKGKRPLEKTRVSDDALESFAGLSLSDTTQKNSGTTVINDGRQIPCSMMGEIKSKAKMPGSLKDFLPQLWFGRIPHLLLGTHTSGTFDNIHHIDAEAEFTDWEKNQQESLRKMAHLLSELKDIVQAAGGACVAVCNHKGRPLTIEILKFNSPNEVLTSEIVEQFWRNER